MLELYVDGHRVLRTSAWRQRTSTGVQLAPGPHRVLLKFAGSAAPVRIAVVREPQAHTLLLSGDAKVYTYNVP